MWYSGTPRTHRSHCQSPTRTMDFKRYMRELLSFEFVQSALCHTSPFIFYVAGLLLCFYMSRNYPPANEVAMPPTTIYEVTIFQEPPPPTTSSSKMACKRKSRRWPVSCATILYSYCSYFSDSSPDKTFSYMEIRRRQEGAQRLVPRHYWFRYW